MTERRAGILDFSQAVTGRYREKEDDLKQRSWSAAITCYSLVFMSLIILAWSCAPQPSGISGTIEFRLRASKKAKKHAAKSSSVDMERPQDAPPLFIPREGHKVEARVTLTGLQPGKEEVVHLVWLKPDGKELFRKIEEFVPDGDTESLRSTIGISPGRERDPGKYAFKVYRHRRLLATGVFEIGEPTD
jgi:hypothetical protein